MSPCPRCGDPTRAAVYVRQADGRYRLCHRRRGGGRCVCILPLTQVPAGATLVPETTAAESRIETRHRPKGQGAFGVARGR